MPLDHERRTQRRMRLERPVYVDYPELRARLRDISLAGAYIEDHRPLPRGRMLQLRIWLDKEISITPKAMIRRSDEGQGMGVEFLSMSDEDMNRLRQHVGASAQVERLQSY